MKDFKDALRQLAEQVKGPYFLGEEWSLVDTAMAPFAVRDYILSEHRGYRRDDVGNGWKEYAEKLESRESVVKTSSVSVDFCVIPVILSTESIACRTRTSMRKYTTDT